jgi:hypothetical protein
VRTRFVNDAGRERPVEPERISAAWFTDRHGDFRLSRSSQRGVTDRVIKVLKA